MALKNLLFPAMLAGGLASVSGVEVKYARLMSRIGWSPTAVMAMYVAHLFTGVIWAQLRWQQLHCRTKGRENRQSAPSKRIEMRRWIKLLHTHVARGERLAPIKPAAAEPVGSSGAHRSVEPGG